MLTRMAIASHNFFRLKYTLLPPWDELPPEAQATGVEHAKVLLEAAREPTGGMNVAAAELPYASPPDDYYRAMIDAAAAGK